MQEEQDCGHCQTSPSKQIPLFLEIDECTNSLSKYDYETYVKLFLNEIELNCAEVHINGNIHNDQLEDCIQSLDKKNEEVEQGLNHLETLIAEFVHNQ